MSPPELSPVRVVPNDGATEGGSFTEQVAKKAAPFDVHATHRCLHLGAKQRRGGAAYNNNSTSNNRYFDSSRHPTERATPRAVRPIKRWSEGRIEEDRSGCRGDDRTWCKASPCRDAMAHDCTHILSWFTDVPVESEPK